MFTIIIIAVTSLISIQAFKNNALADRFIFYPPDVKKGEWYRLFTYGVLHADFTHLFFNMFTLYLFGSYIESIFKSVLGTAQGVLLYILLYVSALLVSILPTYIKQKNNYYYRGLGASGAVSAVVFAYILINPMSFMGIMFIPIMLPAFLFGVIYIILSIYLDKNHPGGINHSAHITGGIYGILFTVATLAVLGNVNIVSHFWNQIHITSIKDLIHIGF